MRTEQGEISHTHESRKTKKKNTPAAKEQTPQSFFRIRTARTTAALYQPCGCVCASHFNAHTRFSLLCWTRLLLLRGALYLASPLYNWQVSVSCFKRPLNSSSPSVVQCFFCKLDSTCRVRDSICIPRSVRLRGGYELCKPESRCGLVYGGGFGSSLCVFSSVDYSWKMCIIVEKEYKRQ